MYWTLGTNATAYSSLTVNGVPQYQPANPAGGVPAGTEITAAALNDFQAEMLNILLTADVAPAENTPTQVLQALHRIFGDVLYQVDLTVTNLDADELGFCELVGDAAHTLYLPSPATTLTPLIMFYNATAYPQTLETTVGIFGGPGGSGETTVTLAPGQVMFMRADTANYICVGPGILASQFSQLAHYTVNQSGSVAVGATNTTYTIESLTVTMPAASKTGGFRVLARIIGKATSTAEAVRNNFTGSVSDGTTSFLGAEWLFNVPDSGDSAGSSDTILISTVYSPGETVTFTHKILTAGGDLAFSITGCSMELYVEEA